MDLWIARHGQTVMNQESRFYGWSDSPLTVRGIEQAHQLSQQLAHDAPDLTPTALVTSTLGRTIHTMELVTKDLGIHLPMTMVSGLKERDCGQWDGLTAEEIEQTDYDCWWAYIDDPFGVTPTKGEAFDAFRQRVNDCFEQLMANFTPKDQVLLVGHLGVLRVIAQDQFKDPRPFWEIDYQQGKFYHYTKVGESQWKLNTAEI